MMKLVSYNLPKADPKIYKVRDTPLEFCWHKNFFTFVKSRNIGIDFFSVWVSLSRPFTNHGTAGKGGGHLLNSSLPLPAVSQTLRHWPGDYCRELTSTHSQQLNSNRKPLISERKLLTTKLWALIFFNFFWVFKDCFDNHGCNFDDVNNFDHSRLKVKYIWDKGYDVVISVHDVTNKILSRNTNYIDIKSSLVTPSISMREVIITSVS